MHAKVVASVLVVVGAVGYLFWSTSSAEDLEYYKHVDEVMSDPQKWTGPRLKLGGKVQDGSIFNKPGTLDYVFTVEEEGKQVQVRYSGVVPDTFKDGSEVVVAGKLTEAGHFEAKEVIAKCPSKYEAEGDTHPMDVPTGDGTAGSATAAATPSTAAPAPAERPVPSLVAPQADAAAPTPAGLATPTPSDRDRTAPAAN